MNHAYQDLELRKSRVEDLIYTILDNANHLMKVQDEMREEQIRMRQALDEHGRILNEHSTILKKIAARLDIDLESQ